MGKRTLNDLLILLILTILSTLLVWLPFISGYRQGMLTVFANYDGPNYLVVAKSLYDKAFIAKTFSLPLPLEYYPAHFPLYPLSIRLLNFVLPGTWSMLLSTLGSTILAVFAFYYLVKSLNLTKSPLWLSCLFLFLPARWLAVRSVGSPEPLFLFAILVSIYFFSTKKYFLAALFGVIAQLTKTPGILLFASYLLYFSYLVIRHKVDPLKTVLKSLPLFLIPLSALSVFLFYQYQLGDFWAYFHSGDNFHLVFPPFQSFISQRSWLGDFWLEEMIFYYLFGALTVILLFKKQLYTFTCFALVFFLATLLVAHRDLARYMLPLSPFSLIAFAPFLEKKEFKIAFGVVLVGIYLYAINFLSGNTAPVADWTPYL